MTSYPLVNVGVVLAVLTVAAPSSAQDDSVVSIKRGTFEVEVLPFDEDSNELRIFGNRGFSLNGRALFGSNFYDAVEQCLLPECTPGAVISLSDVWSGSDFTFDAKLRGIRYSSFAVGEFTSGRIAFSASVTMPPLSDGPVSVSAPFEFAGLFGLGFEGPHPQTVVATGGGTVTVTLVPNPFWGEVSWMIERIVFTFRPLGQR